MWGRNIPHQTHVAKQGNGLESLAQTLGGDKVKLTHEEKLKDNLRVSAIQHNTSLSHKSIHVPSIPNIEKYITLILVIANGIVSLDLSSCQST